MHDGRHDFRRNVGRCSGCGGLQHLWGAGIDQLAALVAQGLAGDLFQPGATFVGQLAGAAEHLQNILPGQGQ